MNGREARECGLGGVTHADGSEVRLLKIPVGENACALETNLCLAEDDVGLRKVRRGACGLRVERLASGGSDDRS